MTMIYIYFFLCYHHCLIGSVLDNNFGIREAINIVSLIKEINEKEYKLNVSY